MFSEKILEHFKDPKNVGEMAGADGVGTVGNPVCGDLLTFYIKVADGKISDAKFKTFGCGAAIAISSILTEKVIGMQVDDAALLKSEDVYKEGEGLPPNKMHCSNLGLYALKKAIKDYRTKAGGGPFSPRASFRAP